MNIGERIKGYIKEKTEAASAQEKSDVLVANTVLGIFRDISKEMLGGRGVIDPGLLNRKTIILEWGRIINPETLGVECNRIKYMQRRDKNKRYCIRVPAEIGEYVIDINDPDWKERLEIVISSLVELGMCRFEGPIPL